MASGKSTIGPILANTLGWDFYDLDKEIEEEIGLTVVKIFELKGEDYFREIESRTLAKLSELQNVVISLGGGTSSYRDNIKIIRNSGKIVYLKASPESLFKRLQFKSDRPMIRQDDQESADEALRNKINTLLTERKPFYEQADLIINTDDYSLGVTVDKLAKLIIRELYEKD